VNNIFLGLICIFVSYKTYDAGILYIYNGFSIELGIYKIPIVFILFALGIYLILKFKKDNAQ